MISPGSGEEGGIKENTINEIVATTPVIEMTRLFRVMWGLACKPYF